MQIFKTYAFLVLAAFIYTLGFPNVLDLYIPFMPILSTAIITTYIFRADSTKQRFKYYFFYNAVICLISFYWITNTLQEFGNIPFIFAAMMNAAYTFMFNPHYIALILGLAVIDRYRPCYRDVYFTNGLFSVLLAGIMTCGEFFITQQFPVLLGQPWIIYSEYLGAASIFGVSVFSFFSYLLAFDFVRFFKTKKVSNLNLLSILGFIIVNPFLVQPEYLGEKTDFNVRLVQANISNFLKSDSEQGGYSSVSKVLNRYGNLSTMPTTNGQPIDLIVWPETAYPYPVRSNKDNILESPIPKIFKDIIFTMNSPMLIGGYDHYKDNEDHSYFKIEYNAALMLNKRSQLEEVYHKHILIPFGETLPLGPLNRWASDYVSEMAFFEEGSRFPSFKTEKGIHFISSICYEAK